MARQAVRKPSWVKIPFRVVVYTTLLTLMTFSVSLLLGIIGVLIHAQLRGIRPDLPFAYKHIALPVAIVAGAIILVLSLIMEIRHYRQARVLAGIERAS
jgi:hypothetical protein